MLVDLYHYLIAAKIRMKKSAIKLVDKIGKRKLLQQIASLSHPSYNSQKLNFLMMSLMNKITFKTY